MGDKHITNDDLARIIQENVGAKMATKDDLELFRTDVESSFQAVTERLDRIQNSNP